MRERWRGLWARVDAEGDGEAAFDELTRCYGEPHRVYHTLRHVAQTLSELDTVREMLAAADRVEMALWLHDVVYDTHAPDNEAQSAAYARRVLGAAGLGDELVGEVGALILATRHDGRPETIDAALLVDVDLSILGQPPAVFDAYEGQIRAEHSWVPEADYVTGRGAVLRRFLDRDFIFATDVFRARYEAQARANLRRAVARLTERRR
jgi:predicted metal-dependent HD superfamily phosphohydrolase